MILVVEEINSQETQQDHLISQLQSFIDWLTLMMTGVTAVNDTHNLKSLADFFAFSKRRVLYKKPTAMTQRKIDTKFGFLYLG